MKNENGKIKIFNNLIWKFSERISAQAITFIVSIILARLLSPSDYGVIAILLVFIIIADVFVNAGFGNALIQKKDADDLDFSSVFYCGLACSIIIYAIIYFCAPIIAEFYNMPVLEKTLQVLAMRIPIAAVNSVQQAYVSRKMQFKKFFYSTLSGTAISAIVGIMLAYNGFGVWALIWQYLSNALVNTVVLFCVINWQPRLIFSFNRLKNLFNYGWKLLLSGLLDTGYNSLSSLFIGKFYTPLDLAFFDTGKKFPMLIVNNINATISSVLFPALASEQDDQDKIKAHIRKAIKISSYIMWPMMFGIAICAEDIISIVLTDKWLSAAPYLQIACITYGLWPIHTANLQAINAMGRSDIFLKLEIIKKIMGIAGLLISIQYGVLAIALSEMIIGVISTFVNSFPNKALLNYTYFEQIKDIFSNFLIAFIMTIILMIIPIEKLNFGCLENLLLKIVFGVAIYIFLSVILNNSTFKYLLSMIKD